MSYHTLTLGGRAACDGCGNAPYLLTVDASLCVFEAPSRSLEILPIRRRRHTNWGRRCPERIERSAEASTICQPLLTVHHKGSTLMPVTYLLGDRSADGGTVRTDSLVLQPVPEAIIMLLAGDTPADSVFHHIWSLHRQVFSKEHPGIGNGIVRIRGELLGRGGANAGNLLQISCDVGRQELMAWVKARNSQLDEGFRVQSVRSPNAPESKRHVSAATRTSSHTTVNHRADHPHSHSPWCSPIPWSGVGHILLPVREGGSIALRCVSNMAMVW